MSMETESTQVSFESPARAGLYQVILGAARAVVGSDLDSPGILEIRPEPGSQSAGVSFGIEATFAEGVPEPTVAKLDLRVRARVEQPSHQLLEAALGQFGGLDFTNLCLGPASSADWIDVTVSFGSRVPMLATNICLMGDSLLPEQRAVCEAVLEPLKVSFSRRGERLRIRRWQLRRRIDLDSQLRAFEVAARGDWRASIYAAALPPARAVRIEIGPEEAGTGRYLDLCLSRGLRGGMGTTSSDAQLMQQLVEQHLGLEFGGRRYRVGRVRWSMPLPSPSGRRSFWGPGRGTPQ